MARMLQALKNLEARTVRPPAGQLAQGKAASPAPPAKPAIVSPEPVSPKPISIKLDAAAALSPMPAAAVPTAAETMESLNTVITGLASLETGGHDGLFPSLSAAPATISTPPAWSVSSPGYSLQTPGVQKPAAAPTVTDIEQMARRTLADAVRSKPLRELVNRLQRDTEQTAAKTVAFVGVTEASTTHEAIILAATVMAQQQTKVLMMDGDASRRSLSEALEYGRDSGLAELLHDGGSALKACRPTATENLSFVPNGSSPPGDAWQPSGLGQICGELARSFACVLIDGGRAGDAGATALARAADATYLVVQLGTVETSAAQAALAALRTAGARVLGC